MPWEQAVPVRQAPPTRVLESLEASDESLHVLQRLGPAIEDAVPLAPKHRANLGKDIRDLWKELTSEREYRNEEYLGSAAAHSAYVRYFLPWNVFRVISVFSTADFALPPGAVVADFGSGPLTVPIALYASRPELRTVPLTIYCLDRVSRIMETGRLIFESLCLKTEGRLPPWTIKTIKASFGIELSERAHLVTSVNLFNEFFWKLKGSLSERARDTARSLLSYCRDSGSIFVMEPGDPRSAALISALRACMLSDGSAILAPCPHSRSCPMPGIFRGLPSEEASSDIDEDEARARRHRAVQSGTQGSGPGGILGPVAMPRARDKYPWCHFALSTNDAPLWLSALSSEAGLPKERAVLSYVWAMRRSAGSLRTHQAESTSNQGAHHHGDSSGSRGGRVIPLRIVSEPFALPGGSAGQYACSSLGYSLLTTRYPDPGYASGSLVEIEQNSGAAEGPSGRGGRPRAAASLPVDEKSGAIILSP